MVHIFPRSTAVTETMVPQCPDRHKILFLPIHVCPGTALVPALIPNTSNCARLRWNKRDDEQRLVTMLIPR